jgi:DNA-binding FadR family transcriptional regulator
LKIKEIVECLSERIRTDEIVVGGKLLPERELSALMGVNRPALRQALAVLEVLGVTEVHPRDGIYIRDKTRNCEDDVALFSIWPADVIPQVFELRTILEPYAAKFAASRKESEDIKRLYETHENMINLANSNDEATYLLFLRWNRIFHELIVKASKNRILEQTYLANLAAYERAMTYMEQNDKKLRSHKWPVLTIKEHGEIISAIESENAELAFNLMKSHISDGAMRAEIFMRKTNLSMFQLKN